MTTTRMSTYEKIKELLEANLDTITTKIDLHRELVTLKLEELKKDTEEIKNHARETNGYVADNRERVRELEELAKRGQRIWKAKWWIASTAILVTIILSAITQSIGLFEFFKLIFRVGVGS